MDPLHLAHDLATVAMWWASVADNSRKSIYRPGELRAATGITPQALPHVLMLAGWQRARHWTRENNRRQFRTFYAPPGHTVPPPLRGRPSTASVLADLFGLSNLYDARPR